jgi:hypothetical protein
LTIPQPPHSIQRAPPLKVGCQRSSSADGSVKGSSSCGSASSPRAEQLPADVVERALEVRHRDALVDDEALELVERGQVRRVELVGAVDAPRAEHVDAAGSAALEHRAHLHGLVCVRSTRCRSTGSTKNVSCIWRAGWSTSKFSASKLNHSCSSSGPFGDLPAHADEEVRDLLLQEETGCRADARPRRDRDVDALGLELRSGLRLRELRLTGASACVTRPRA